MSTDPHVIEGYAPPDGSGAGAWSAEATPAPDEVAIVPVPPAIERHTADHAIEPDAIASWPGYSAVGPLVVPDGPPNPITGQQAAEISVVVVCGACGATFIIPLDRRMRAPVAPEATQA